MQACIKDVTHARTTITHVDKGHGRVEERTLTVLNAPDDLGFPHAAQIGQIHRVRWIQRHGSTVKTTEETVLWITSLSAERASPEQLAQWLREHWHIENKLHYVRDVTLQEDASQVRSGHAPLIFACVRNSLVSLLHRMQETSIVATLRACAWNRNMAFTLLGITSIN